MRRRRCFRRVERTLLQKDPANDLSNHEESAGCRRCPSGSLLQAFSHLHNFQGKSSFSTWLTRIAINAALMILRKRRGGVEISTDSPANPSGQSEQWEVAGNTEDPESYYSRREREELLRDAILRLTPMCREVVELWRAKEFSTREIAGTLGISVPAVKSRLARARLTLRTALLPLDS